MNCYQHHQTVAVGLCKNCSRGLCLDCAHDAGFGLACKDRCEAEVKSLSQVIARNISAYGKTAAIYNRAAVLYGLMGLMFLLFAVFILNDLTEIRYLFYAVGGVFFFGAVLQLINAKRIKDANEA